MRRALAARPPGPGKGIPQMKMTTEEAFVKVLQMHGIEHGFGIIGSAFMPISDLFPKAGIAFWAVAHEPNGGLICAGYTRATGKMAMAIAKNGPGARPEGRRVGKGGGSTRSAGCWPNIKKQTQTIKITKSN